MVGARVVDQRAASDMDMFAVEGVLQQFDDVITNGVGRFETLASERPRVSRDALCLSSVRLALVHVINVPRSSAVCFTGKLKVKPRCSSSSGELVVPISRRKSSTDCAI